MIIYHKGEITLTLMYLNSPATRLFIQQHLWVKNKKFQSSDSLAICAGIQMVTGLVSPLNGPKYRQRFHAIA